MEDYVEPVVSEKPVRGREMKTNVVPTDMFDTMKMVSAKKTLRGESLVPELQQKSNKTAELYHEGYVDGKLYLVPDSNLEAMKDMINFKMKPRRSTRYKHQTSFELTDYDHFRGKLTALLEKIEEFSSESEIEEEEEEDMIKAEEKQRKEEEAEEEEEEKVEEKVEEEEQIEAKPEDEEHRIPEYYYHPMEKPPHYYHPMEKPPFPLEPNRLRFLISGHFYKDREPIYIIQEYRGGPDLFSDQKADFYTKQQEDDVDLSISGRFYHESVLVESEGKPVALDIKPFKIPIDEKTSNIYTEYFEQVYKFASTDILLKGEFIKSKITHKITPFLTLDIRHKYPAEPNIRSERDEDYRRPNPSTAVMVYKPEFDNPFGKGDENHYVYPVFDEHGLHSDAIVLQSTIALPVLPQGLAPTNAPDQGTHRQASERDEVNVAVNNKPGELDIDMMKELRTVVDVHPFDAKTRNKLANMAENNGVTIEDGRSNMSLRNLVYKSSYSIDLEQTDSNRFEIRKQKKKRKPHKMYPLARTSGSLSFPILQENKVKRSDVT